MLNSNSKKSGLLLIGLLLALPAIAQSNRPVAAPRHTLWQVTGTSNVVYLLGSVHLLSRTNYPLAAPIESAFTHSRIAVFETDIGKMDQPEAQQEILSSAMLPDGQSLAQALSAGVYGLFSNHVAQAGLPLMMFDHLKPSMAAMMIEVIEMQKLGADPEYGVDQYFFKRARDAGDEIVPLETVDFQIHLVTDFTPQEGEMLMQATLKDIDKTRTVLGDMIGSWQTGDTAKLGKLLNEGMQEAPVIFKRLVTDRSRRWVPEIETLLRGGKNAIVIVGAGHLVGEGGVVELLKRDGWKIQQL